MIHPLSSFWLRRWKTFSDEASAALSQALHKKVIENSWMRRDINCGAGGDSDEGNPAFRWKSLESRSLFTHDGDIASAKVGKRLNPLHRDNISQRQRAKQILTGGWKTIEHTVGKEKKVGKPAREETKIFSQPENSARWSPAALSELLDCDAENFCEDEKQNAGSSLCLFSERASFFFLRLVCILHRSYIRSLFSKLLDTFFVSFLL